MRTEILEHIGRNAARLTGSRSWSGLIADGLLALALLATVSLLVR